jgi:hypothetical protein
MVDLLVLGFKKQEGILHDQDNGGIGGDQKGGALETLNSLGCREAVSCITLVYVVIVNCRYSHESPTSLPPEKPIKRPEI